MKEEIYKHQLTFDFRMMRDENARNIQRQPKDRWDAKKLIEECTYYKESTVISEEVAKHYTIVTYTGIDEESLKDWMRFTNALEIKRYFASAFDLDFAKLPSPASNQQLARPQRPGLAPYEYQTGEQRQRGNRALPAAALRRHTAAVAFLEEYGEDEKEA